MIKRIILLIVFFALAGGGAWFAGQRLAASVETIAQSRAEALFRAGGHGWASAEADGLKLTLTGEAPTEAERDRAASAALSLSLLARLDDQTTRRPPPEPVKTPGRLEALRSAEAVTLIGRADANATPAALLSRIAALRPDLTLSSLMEVGEAQPLDPAWPNIADHIAALVADLDHGTIVVAEDTVAVRGVVADAEARSRLDPVVTALTASNWAVSLDLETPPTPIPDYALIIVKGGSDNGLKACAAPDADAGESLTTRAMEVLGGAATPDCEIGAGAFDAGWTQAGLAAISALGTLPAGAAELTQQKVRLIGNPPTRATILAEAAANLREALPAGYTAEIVIGEGLTLAATDTTPVAEPTPTPLTITWTGEALTLNGAMDQVTGDGLLAYAAAQFTGVTPSLNTVEDGVELPAGWRLAALSTLDAMSLLEKGEATLEKRQATVAGDVAAAPDVKAAHVALSAREWSGWRIQSNFRVSPERLAAAQVMPAARCADALTKEANAQPLSFKPSSAALTATGLRTVRRLAEILTRCAPNARFEIGGHTDSQGRERANLALSRSRAEAVLSSLLAAGAPIGVLTAQGYGESLPIADNSTEEGRARNRRIEFTPLSEEAE
ncbi:MAG: OmpA family protein [Pseudomonadota bacterium]